MLKCFTAALTIASLLAFPLPVANFLISVEGSEFDDYTNDAEEVENEIEALIKKATEL